MKVHPVWIILLADVLAGLRSLASNSVHMCIASPPYLGLRAYEGVPESLWGGEAGCDHQWGEVIPPLTGDNYGEKQGVWQRNRQRYGRSLPRGRFCALCGGWWGTLGNEPDYRMHIDFMVEIYAEILRILHNAGTNWINYGHVWAQRGKKASHQELASNIIRASKQNHDSAAFKVANWQRAANTVSGACKPKDLMLIPERLQIALQERLGWWIRMPVIWWKPNAKPLGVQDRFTDDLETLYVSSKSSRYYFDHEAILRSHGARERCVWRINTEANTEHSAAFPLELVRRAIKVATSQEGCCPACLMPQVRMWEKIPPEERKKGRRRRFLGWRAGCRCQAGDPIPCTVLDPFCGSGTTGVAARLLGRSFVGVEVSPIFHARALERIEGALRPPPKRVPKKPRSDGQRTFAFRETNKGETP